MFSVDGSNRNRLIDAITPLNLFRTANNHEEEGPCQSHLINSPATHTSEVLSEESGMLNLLL